jgi:hypothetical protein
MPATWSRRVLEAGDRVDRGDHSGQRGDAAHLGPPDPSEPLDYDDVRNDNGDVVADAPDRSIAHIDHQSLAGRLAAENRTTPDSATRWVMPSMTLRQGVHRVGIAGTGS